MLLAFSSPAGPDFHVANFFTVQNCEGKQNCRNDSNIANHGVRLVLTQP